jgi:hypothetical protein
VDACNRVFLVQHCPPVAARMSAKSRSMARQAAQRAELTWALRTTFLPSLPWRREFLTLIWGPNQLLESESKHGMYIVQSTYAK